MAGGTGGHIFPALSIAEKLREMGVNIEWLGSASGLEVQILGDMDYTLHLINARGLRGKGVLSLLLAPLMIVRATVQAYRVMARVRPDCVLGMGGFVTGPGGVAARLRGIRLLIHEQNAVPGITNRMLMPFAFRVLEAFPETFAKNRFAENKTVTVGNPVRRSIASSGSQKTREDAHRLRVLVLGGSQGARAINTVVPAALGLLEPESRPQVLHQAGKDKVSETLAGYAQAGIVTGADVRVQDFIKDIAQAYTWADLVICRSGASTVAEIAAAGLPAILIPYPYHKDQQQVRNARWLSETGAALLVEQDDLSPAVLRDHLKTFNCDRSRTASMSAAALDRAITDADERIALLCLETSNG